MVVPCSSVNMERLKDGNVETVASVLELLQSRCKLEHSC